MSETIAEQLAPGGVLRAGINMSNFLLVTGRTESGDPDGVSPDMARALGERLGLPVQLTPFATPGELADAAADDAWDIGLIGAEPQRAEKIAFSLAYSEIEATYLVPAGSPIRSVDEVDQAGNRIAVAARSAYELWLSRNIREAELVRVAGLGGAFDRFVADGLEALAGLRPGLIKDIDKLPGARILEGRFSAVQQAIGVPRTRPEAAARFVAEFVEEAKTSGLVASLIARHGVEGRLMVAAPGA